MARYIDADNLNFEGQNYNKSQMKAIPDFVDAQPTAYDVDAVVEKLEKDTTCRFRLDGYIPKSKAIDIVRNAGKDGVK